VEDAINLLVEQANAAVEIAEEIVEFGDRIARSVLTSPTRKRARWKTGSTIPSGDTQRSTTSAQPSSKNWR